MPLEFIPASGLLGRREGPLCPALHAPELTLCILLATTPHKWFHKRALRWADGWGSREAHPLFLSLWGWDQCWQHAFTIAVCC